MTDYSPEPQADAAAKPWGRSAAPSPSVQATMGQMTDQLQTVIDAAERAAEAIRFDAEEQARHHLADAQRKADRLTAERVGLISDLTDDLIRHAGTVRDHSEQMIQALEDAISSVTTKLEQPAVTDSFADSEDPGQAAIDEVKRALPPASAPAAPASEPAPDASAAAPAQARPAAAAPVSEEALLHATRLAVAGNDRATIAAALRDGYGVANPEPLVARVLGES